MENKVLVAYATTHGSTKEVAEVIAATMKAEGLTVDLLMARNSQTVDGYNAIILGSPIYMLHMHKEATQFLARHRTALSNGLPIAIFAGGPTRAGEDDWGEVQKQLDRELAKFPWLKPAVVQVIGGKLDPESLHFPWNLIPAMRQSPPSDLRDWATIQSWALAQAAKFQPDTKK